MDGTLETSSQTNSSPSPKCICSAGWESGLMPFVRPDGTTPEKCGPEAAPASPSPEPTSSARPSATSDISGPTSSASSASAALQQSLVSKLRPKTDSLGSTLFTLTWKTRATPAGRSISALRASVPRTSGSAFTLWPTPDASAWRRCGQNPERVNPERSFTINDAARMASWPTPSASGFEAVDTERLEKRRAECKERTGNGNGFGLTLGQAVPLYLRDLPTDSGGAQAGSTAGTGSSGRLNPELPRWLMGLPTEWAKYAPTEMPSSRPQRKPS